VVDGGGQHSQKNGHCPDNLARERLLFWPSHRDLPSTMRYQSKDDANLRQPIEYVKWILRWGRFDTVAPKRGQFGSEHWGVIMVGRENVRRRSVRWRGTGQRDQSPRPFWHRERVLPDVD